LNADADHIRALLKQHRLRVRWLDDDAPLTDSVTCLDDRILHIRRVRSVVTYAIALHEIGHHCSQSKSKPRIEQEACAWAWAKQHARRWTPSMQATMLRGLKSYLQMALTDYGRAVPRQLRLPPRGSPLWTLAADLPETKALLALDVPSWLHPLLPVIPWGNVLSHAQRPRCSNCAFWRHTVTYDRGETEEKKSFGECAHRLHPLGTDITPGGALCGTAWVSRT